MDKTDKRITDLLKLVEAKKSQLADIKKPNWATPCCLDFLGSKVNIQVSKDLTLLAQVRGWFIDMLQSYEDAQTEWQVKFPMNYKQYPISDWIDDIGLRVKVLNVKNEENKLKILQARLDELLSPEQKRQLELQQLEQELIDADSGQG